MYTYTTTQVDENVTEHVVAKDGIDLFVVAEGDAHIQEIVTALNAWEWLKENIPTNMKMWGLLPANYCINCKREHDDGDCYA